jgi:hypothetical protein
MTTPQGMTAEKAEKVLRQTAASARVWSCHELEAIADLIQSQAAELAGLRAGAKWIPVSERLPEDGQEIIGFIDIEKMNPVAASHMRLIQSSVNGLRDEERSIPIGDGRRVELYAKREPSTLTRKVQHGIASIEKDGDGALFCCMRRAISRDYITNSDCLTHWQPLPPAPINLEDQP